MVICSCGGEFDWARKENLYLCKKCDLNVPIITDDDLSTFLLRVKRFGGDNVSWEFLQKLKDNKKFITDFEDRVRQMSNGKFKLEEGLSITPLFETYSKSLEDSTVQVGDGTARANFAKWEDELTAKIGESMELRWYEIKAGTRNKEDLLVALDKLSNEFELKSYTTANILDKLGLWSGGRWALWLSESAEKWGETILEKWSKYSEDFNGDNWELCDISDAISRDIGISAKLTMQILAELKQIEMDNYTASMVYIQYNCARKSLGIIINEGPATTQDIVERLSLNSSTASSSLKDLYERDIVNRYKDFGRAYFYYVNGQEGQLKERSLFFRLENGLMLSAEYYTTINKIGREGGLSKASARNFLKRLVSEGKVLEVNDFVPNIYIPLNKDRLTSIKKGLRNGLAKYLKQIPPEGVSKTTLMWRLETSQKTLDNVFSKLEEYNLVYFEDEKYYLHRGFK